MEINNIKFLTSNTDYEKCPKPDKPEYAFIGRSNVGKSSLINYLCNRNKLAYTSSKPGRTQTINHYLVDNAWYLVDLPGYGYAKASKKQRDKTADMIENYARSRINLQCLFVLIDARHEPLKIDIDFINWLGINEVPIAIIFTKTDKVKPGRLDKHMKAFSEELKKAWTDIPNIFSSSAVEKEGKDHILSFIDAINKQIFSGQ